MLPYLHLNLYFFQREQPTFGLMMWLAAVAAAYVMHRSFRRARISSDAIGMVAVAVVIGIVGAKLWHVFDTPDEFHYLGWRVFLDTDGFAWFGGLTFGIAALVFQGWREKIGGLRILDLAAPAAAIGYGMGRIGCFLSGDGCYGIPIQPVHIFSYTFHPWGMAFPHGVLPIFVPVYPTPLYELTANLLIGGWLWWRLGKSHRTGAILGQYLLLTGIARFLVEFIRRNPKVLWGMSNAQLAAAGSAIAGVILVAWLACRPAAAPDEASEPVENAA